MSCITVLNLLTNTKLRIFQRLLFLKYHSFDPVKQFLSGISAFSFSKLQVKMVMKSLLNK